MKKLSVGFGALLVLLGCDEAALTGAGGVPTGGGFSGGAPIEYLVLGSSMPFEECRARGGMIIRDQGSPMVACDPRVRRAPVPAGEFDHPGSPVPQTAPAEG